MSHRKHQRAITQRHQRDRFIKRIERGEYPLFREVTAIHEAGHAVALLEHGWPLESISIQPRGATKGRCTMVDIAWLDAWYRDQPAEVMLTDAGYILGAGYAAERWLTVEDNIGHARDDVATLWNLVKLYHPDEDQETWRTLNARYFYQARNYLAQNKRLQAVKCLAIRLVEKQTITRDEAARCVQHLIPVCPPDKMYDDVFQAALRRNKAAERTMWRQLIAQGLWAMIVALVFLSILWIIHPTK